jgi:hypothetical protein
MKHLKKFEELDQDYGRFSNEDEFREEDYEQAYDHEDEEDDTNDELGGDYDDLGQDQDDYGNSEDEDEDEEDGEEHDWNDNEIVESKIMRWNEISEKKKTNPGFQAYLDKQKAKKEGKDKKDDKDPKDKKDDKKEPVKGLTTKQKKLPEAMQKAILKRQK